jgi:hypothetical protein
MRPTKMRIATWIAVETITRIVSKIHEGPIHREHCENFATHIW